MPSLLESRANTFWPSLGRAASTEACCYAQPPSLALCLSSLSASRLRSPCTSGGGGSELTWSGPLGAEKRHKHCNHAGAATSDLRLRAPRFEYGSTQASPIEPRGRTVLRLGSRVPGRGRGAQAVAQATMCRSVHLHPPSSIRRARETENNNSLGGFFSLCGGFRR